MPFPWAAAIPLATSAIGKLTGGDQKTEAVVPNDLSQMRANQIGLMNYFQGFGADPRAQAPTWQQRIPGYEQFPPEIREQMRQGYEQQRQQDFYQQQYGGQQQPQQPAFNPGAMPLFGQGAPPISQGYPQSDGQSGGMGQMPVLYGPGGPNGGGQAGGYPGETPSSPAVLPNVNMQGVPGMTPGGSGGGQVGQQGGGAMTPQQRLESFFGQLGINPGQLQQQATSGYQRMLQQPTPEQRAADISLPQIQQSLSGNQGTQGAMNSLMGLQTGAGADVEGRLSQIGDRPITGFGGLDSVLQQLAGGQGGATNFNGRDIGINELRGIAGGQNPGQGVVDALDPSFQRNLASANQQGGRFGSGNAILRSRAVDDFNLTAANALQRGVDQQTAAASAMGQLGLGNDSLRLQGLLGGQQGQLDALRLATSGSQGLDQSALQALNSLGGFRLQGQQQQAQNLNSAGNLGLGQGQLGNQTAQTIGGLYGQQGQAERGLLGDAFGAGTVETNQQNVGNQRAIDILLQQLATAQGATLGGPVQQTPSGAQQGAQLGGDIAQLVMMQQYLNKGNG